MIESPHFRLWNINIPATKETINRSEQSWGVSQYSLGVLRWRSSPSFHRRLMHISGLLNCDSNIKPRCVYEKTIFLSGISIRSRFICYTKLPGLVTAPQSSKQIHSSLTWVLSSFCVITGTKCPRGSCNLTSIVELVLNCWLFDAVWCMV